MSIIKKYRYQFVLASLSLSLMSSNIIMAAEEGGALSNVGSTINADNTTETEYEDLSAVIKNIEKYITLSKNHSALDGIDIAAGATRL